ncbi:MAG: FMN-binding protein [Clostridia bacterium]|nr:FMN-binding protein [Clostridia bacterium]
MKKGLILKSIVVLSLICLCTSSLLALTNLVTAPAIAESERLATLESFKKVMPGAENFEEKTLSKSYDGVENAWTCEKGIVVKLSTSGYASGLVIMVGLTYDGTISGVVTMSCNETAGYGKQCEDAWYQQQYAGQTKDLSGVSDISGATKTSRAYRAAVQTAFEVLEELKGGEGK